MLENGEGTWKSLNLNFQYVEIMHFIKILKQMHACEIQHTIA